jgi:hypothetical protein
MSGPRAATEVFADRLAVVLAITEANGLRQRAQAAASGALIERMNLEDHPAGVTPGSLAEAQAQDDAAQRRLAEADARIAELDGRLAALDAELAAAAGR